MHDLYEDLLADPRAVEGESAVAPLLLLDGDHVAVEDIGWIRRSLVSGRLSAVVVMGSDPSETVARRLRQLPGVSWTPWPPDLDDLRRLVERVRRDAPANGATDLGPASSAAASSEGTSTLAGGDVAPALRSPTRGTVARSSADLLTPFTAGAALPPQSISLTVGRDQVAVLADISQRLELAFLALRESGRMPEQELEGPQIELRRLMRFTRSLACLAAPPPRGADEFDVAAVIEELLATLTLRGRRGPRFQPGSGSGGRAAVEFLVHADRAALTMAFETVLSVARLCSSSGDTVRVAYTPIPGNAVAIEIEFPAGPLLGADPEHLLDVALLRERLPELGPNELAAASAIVRSQGGEMDFASLQDGQLAVRVRLPIEQRAPRVRSAARSERSPRAKGDDPFA